MDIYALQRLNFKQILEEIHDHDKVCVLVTMRCCAQLRSEDEDPPGNSLRFQAASAWLRFPAGELLQKRRFFRLGEKNIQRHLDVFCSFRTISNHFFHSFFSSILLGQYFFGDHNDDTEVTLSHVIFFSLLLLMNRREIWYLGGKLMKEEIKRKASSIESSTWIQCTYKYIDMWHICLSNLILVFDASFVRVICILRCKGVELLDDDPIFVLFWTHGNPVSDKIGFRKAWDESVFGSTSPGRRCGTMWPCRSSWIQVTENGMKTFGGGCLFRNCDDNSNLQTKCLPGIFWVLQVDSPESESLQEPKVCLEESSWGTFDDFRGV